MTGKGIVTLNGRIIATDVLIQIVRDADNVGWSGTLYISAGKLSDGEPGWTHDHYAVQLDGGSAGQFIVMSRQPVGTALFLEVRGRGPLETSQGSRTSRV